MRDEQIPEIKALLKTSPTAAIRLSPSSEVEESRFFDIHGKGLHYPSDIQNDLAQAGILQTEAQPDKLPDSKFFVKYVGSKATTHTYEDLSNDQNMSASNSENNSASKTQLTKVDIVTAGANKVKELVLKADQADPIPETKKHDIAKKPASGSKNAKSQASHPKVSPSPKSNQPKPDNQDTKPIKDLVPKSLTAEVAVARHEYATITAELRRKFIVSKKNKELEKKARERINNSHTVMKSSLIDIMKSKDLEPAEQLDILEQEDHLAAEKIAISIKSQSEKLAEPSVRLSNRKQKFNNRWASRGGGEKFDRHRMVGTSKKVGRIALGGLLIGAAAGLAVGGDTGIVIGPVIGSIAAVGTSRKVAQGLAGGHVDKNKNSKTVAQAQSEAHLAATNDSISKIYDQYRSDQIEDVDDISDPSITHYYSKETDKIVSRNRRRLFGAIAIGLASGAIGAIGGEEIRDSLINLFNSHMGPLPTKAQIKPIVKPAHKIIPVINHKFHRVPTYPVINHRPRMLHGKSNQQFYVEPGSGEIREIHEYALAHNYKAPIYRAQSIYSRLLKTYGSNIIKLKGNGPSTYTISPGDIGLAHPGYAHWYPGVEASLRRLLSR